MTDGPAAGWGETAFRWRSYLPLIAVAGLLGGVAGGRAGSELIVRASVAVGSMMAAAGLALRFCAVGQAPAGTSGRHRKQHATALNTFGAYSVVRHPLYLANLLVWSGVSAASGWPLGAVASTVLGVGLFALIVHHEDRFLAASFGADYEEWAAVTPAFLPKLSLWRSARRPLQWRKAVASEYSTTHSVVLLLLLFAAARLWAAGGPRPGPGFWSVAAINSGLYLALRFWRYSQ